MKTHLIKDSRKTDEKTETTCKSESFAAYYCKPDWLKKKCPETYKIIEGIIEEYNG